MSKENKAVQFQIGGLLQLRKVGDYLKLVGATVGLEFRDAVPGLKARKIASTHVAGLSDTGTHLILKKVCVKRFFFFSKWFDKVVVPIANIRTVKVLDKPDR